ncbi:hypothetical protein QE152_g148 [Popillia japonica]|uniref:Uncharacterized protein n=1 Tax=Popillia japonica TaxID=7064 RepID=A0AAW1NL89_POPJA
MDECSCADGDTGKTAPSQRRSSSVSGTTTYEFGVSNATLNDVMDDLLWLDEEAATSSIYKLQGSEASDDSTDRQPVRYISYREVRQVMILLIWKYQESEAWVSSSRPPWGENEKQATLAGAERKRNPIPKQCCNIGVQANANEMAQETGQLEDDIVRYIESTIVTKDGWNGLKKIIDQSWPSSCYKHAEVIAAETMRERKGNLAIIAGPAAAINMLRL